MQIGRLLPRLDPKPFHAEQVDPRAATINTLLPGVRDTGRAPFMNENAARAANTTPRNAAAQARPRSPRATDSTATEFGARPVPSCAASTRALSSGRTSFWTVGR